jgi:transposase
MGVAAVSGADAFLFPLLAFPWVMKEPPSIKAEPIACTRIVNRMKGTLARLGIRNFKPTLRKAAERLATLHMPEGMPLPPNVSAELQRDMARLSFVVSQIKEIEEARQKRLEQQPA